MIYPGLVVNILFQPLMLTKCHLCVPDRRAGHDFSTSNNSPLVSILGQEKYRRVSRITYHARTVPAGERCFFVLLLLVTLIYAIGILTALVLLCFHMWFF